MYNITAVIVTNNRFELLQEAVWAVKRQSYPVAAVIVVDNASTDGTSEWLNSQSGLIVIHQENSGGSGGFHTGIRHAASLNPDWVWVMDDDTICNENTLSNLVQKLPDNERNIGFIGSKAVWKDDTPHLMNLPAIKPSFNKNTPFNLMDDQGLLLVETTSFVSLLLNIKAIRAVGLPYKEFFIWGDDQEYTRRITKANYLGLYCVNSVVLHKTSINYCPDFYRDTVENLWKHSYGFRNEFFMVKKNNGALFFACWIVLKLIYTSYKIFLIRKNHHFRFIGVLFKSAWKAIFFNPVIELL